MDVIRFKNFILASSDNERVKLYKTSTVSR